MRTAATVRRAVVSRLATLGVAGAGLALLGAVLLGGAAGCGDGRREADRAAAAAYGQAAAAARRLQAAFLVAWQESREAETVAELRRLGQERVLPALARYVAALESLPAASERLRELHAGLVAAWQQFGERLRLYYDRVTVENFPKRNAGLQTAWADLGARIVVYRDELGKLYESLGLRLGGDAGAPPGGAPIGPTAGGRDGE